MTFMGKIPISIIRARLIIVYIQTKFKNSFETDLAFDTRGFEWMKNGPKYPTLVDI